MAVGASASRPTDCKISAYGCRDDELKLAESLSFDKAMTDLIWQKLNCKNQPTGGLGAWRAKVPGGWLVAIRCGGGKGAA